MDEQDLLEHYWKKYQAETDPELKEHWEYFVDRLTLMIINDIFG